MKHNYYIHQVLYNWVITLPIDDQSGESIVTEEDVNRLSQELDETFNESSTWLGIRERLSELIPKFLENGNLWNRFSKNAVSKNLFHPLRSGKRAL